MPRRRLFIDSIQTRSRFARIAIAIICLAIPEHVPELLTDFLTSRAAPCLAIVCLDNQQVIFDHIQKVAKKFGARFVSEKLIYKLECQVSETGDFS